jgi:ATP-dependent Lon protease
MFIGTANVLDSIPAPLRDRMEVIELTGYTTDEKLQIAKRYLVRRQLESNGLNPEQCSITDGAILTLIQDYTREAGSPYKSMQVDFYQRVTGMGTTNKNLQANAS